MQIIARPLVRCVSPPVWGLYELDPNEDYSDEDNGYSESGSDSCSEDEEEYHQEEQSPQSVDVVDESNLPQLPSADKHEANGTPVELIAARIPLPPSPPPSENGQDVMDIDHTPIESTTPDATDSAPLTPEDPPSSDSATKDLNEKPEDHCGDCEISPEEQRQRALDKGKAREDPIIPLTPVTTRTSPSPAAVEPEEVKPASPSPIRTKPTRHRPLVTVRSSYGWIWNQEQFIPNYMKDRYVPVAATLHEIATLPTQSTTPMSSTDAGVAFARELEIDCVGLTITPEDLKRVLP